MTRRARLTLAALAMLAAGCASVAPDGLLRTYDATPALRDCARWYAEEDARVEAAAVRDAQDARVPGFPHLRTNRLLASWREEATANERKLEAMVERMHTLDIQARRREAANLPVRVPGVRDHMAERIVMQRASACGLLMREADLADAQARALLLAGSRVPDEPSSALRVLGRDALAGGDVEGALRRHEMETRAAFQRDPATTRRSSVVRYSPHPSPPLPRNGVARMIEFASANPLGIPELGELETEMLFAAHAPSLEIEITGEHDRLGAIRWLRGAPMPMVDGAELVVYRHLAWTRYRERVLLQVVYTAWFPARAPVVDGDLLAGTLDGLTWRVTLAPDGEPVVYDAINASGTEHFFFPTPRAVPLPAPAGSVGWMFAPQQLPRVAEGERPVLRIASGSHRLEGVSLVRGADSIVRYELRPYEELRSIARLDGRQASMFGPGGEVAGSERPPAASTGNGAIRQWGRQGTGMTSPRHFDDPDLIERRFAIDLR
jgi:hypothetical protein